MAFTFTPEDGTGLAAANAYIDVAFADDYHSGDGNTDWTGTDAVKKAAIVSATRHIEQRFSQHFKGVISDSDQGLSWPRDYVYDERGNTIDEVPDRVKKACAEYALRALSGELYPDPAHDAKGIVKSKSERVAGAVSESVEYAALRPAPSYPAADALLRPLLHAPGVIRA